MPDGTVFVIFHGLITLVKRRNGFYTGFFVEMDDHEYLAGSWLNERPIPPSQRLALRGVIPGTDEIHGDSNLVVTVQSDLSQTGQALRQVSLPWPKVAHPVFTTNVADKLDPADPPTSSKNLSAITIFEYDTADLASVKLVIQDTGEMVWQALTRRMPLHKRAVTALHLLDEPRFTPKDRDHFKEEFRKTFALLGHNIRIKAPIEIQDVDRNAAAVNCLGLRRMELHDLNVRERVLKVIAQHLLDPEGASGAESIGSEPAVCGGGYGREQ